MSLNKRRILYISFILIFLILTPLISLYAIGYKIGAGFNLQKTGMIIIDTEPRGAKIYINDKIQSHFLKKFYAPKSADILTPVKIKNLLPGEYDIRLEINDYWQWQKKLTILEGQSTFVEDVSLFKKNIPQLINYGEFEGILISPDKEKILALLGAKNGTETILIDPNNENKKSYIASTTNIYKATSTPQWSPSSKKIIIGNIIFSIDAWSEPILLDNLIGSGTKNIKWHPSDENIIYYENNSGVITYNFSNNTKNIILNTAPCEDFLLKGDHLYYINKDNGSSNLSLFNINEQRNFGTISLPKSKYEFTNPKHELINLYDRTHKILYLIDPESTYRPLRDTISNLGNTAWIDSTHLLYSNDFEIWLYDLNNYKKTLLTRISEAVEKIIWHPNDNYAIYATARNINIIELDDREKYNITRLIELENIHDTALSKDNSALYFYAQIGKQEGLYKLLIQ